MNDINVDATKCYIYRNARPLDLARWTYHFENGSNQGVLDALKAFQNKDGGFGHGLELDCLNPESSPIQTWKAMVRLEEIGFSDSSSEIIKGFLRYLESNEDFNKDFNQWMRVIPSNNNYPHAVWWEFNKYNDLYEYNPTAYIAGFIIKYANKNTLLYKPHLLKGSRDHKRSL